MFHFRSMKLKVGGFGLALLALAAACKKSEENTCNYRATVTFRAPENPATASYTPFINDEAKAPLQAGQTVIYDVDTGCYRLRVGSVTDTVCLKNCEQAVYIIR